MRRRAKIDANQKEIVEGLRACGAFVQSLAEIGHGCPDLLASYRGDHYLLEVKGPDGKLTPDQNKWLAECKAPVYVVTNIEEALRAIGARR